MPRTKEQNRLSAKKSALKDPELTRRNQLRWRKENSDRFSATRKNWIEKNKEKVREAARRGTKRHNEKYPHKRRFYQGLRRARKLLATPPWVDLEELKRIHRDCPDGFTVDHIIPLQHSLVCGLHVPWNLQYLSPSENSRKKNRFDPSEWAI